MSDVGTRPVRVRANFSVIASGSVKRGGFARWKHIPSERERESDRRNTRIKVGNDFRRKSKVGPSATQWVPRNPNSTPVARASGGIANVPRIYRDLDFTPQEDVRRRVARGPDHRRDGILPQEENPTAHLGGQHRAPISQERKSRQKDAIALCTYKGRTEFTLSEYMYAAYVLFC